MVELYDMKNMSKYRNRPRFRKRLNQILTIMEKEKYITSKELTQKLGISIAYVRDHLSYLRYDNKIIKLQRGKRTIWAIREIQ